MYTGEPRSSGSSADDEANSVMDVIITPAYQEWLEIEIAVTIRTTPHTKILAQLEQKFVKIGAIPILLFLEIWEHHLIRDECFL